MNKCDIYFCKLNNLRKSFTLLLPYPSAKKHKVLIRQNRKFHNIHMGQRCFILANGPSIQKENLELLRGENILTVNIHFSKGRRIQRTNHIKKSTLARA